jgi:GAF domain-containing protein
MQTLRPFFAPPVFDDEDKTRVARLLNTILLTLIVLMPIIIVGGLAGGTFPPAVYVIIGGAWGIFIALWFVMRRGWLTVVSAAVLAILLAAVTAAIYFGGTIRIPGIAFYVLAILIAGLTLGRRAAAGVAVLSALIVLALFLAEVRGLLPQVTPISIAQWVTFAVVCALTTVLLQLSSRSIEESLERARRNEREVKALAETLEQRVASRTRDLELAAEVGQSLATVRDLDTLLSQAVELIRARFDLYYTQVYLLDPSGRTLVMRAGTGEVGRQLRQRGFRLPVNTGSLNGSAAIERRAVIVADTANTPSFRPNTLLPSTRSEMVVPLVSGERAVGTLDMQSARPGALNEEALPAFQILAAQLAAAIENSQLFEQIEASRAEVEARVQGALREGWQDFLDAVDHPQRIHYTYEAEAAGEGGQPVTVPIEVVGQPIGQIHLEADHALTAGEQELVSTVARQVAQQVESLRLLAEADRYRREAGQLLQRFTQEGWQTYTAESGSERQGYLYDQTQVKALTAEDAPAEGTEVAQPLTVRGETIGELAVEIPERFAQEDKALLSTVAERLSAHIENLRLFASAERERRESLKRASELATVADVSTAASTILEADRLLQEVVDLTKQRFGLYHAHVYLLNEAGTELILKAGAGQVGRTMAAEGRSIPIEAAQSLVAQAARSQKGVIVNDVRSDPAWLPNPLLPDTRSEMAIPLIVGNRVLGVLDVQSEHQGRFTQSDINVQSTLAAQVAAALQNAQLYEETRRRTEELAVLNEMGRALTAVRTESEVYELVYQYASRALDTTNFYIATYDEAAQTVAFPLIYDNRQRISAPARKLGAGMTDYVIRARETLHLSRDVLEGMRTRGIQLMLVGDTRPAQSWLGVPLIYGDQVLGVMAVQSVTTPGLYTEIERDLLTAIANQVVIALENVRSFEATQRRAEREALINTINQRILGATSVEGALQTAAREIGQLLKARRTIVEIGVGEAQGGNGH